MQAAKNFALGFATVAALGLVALVGELARTWQGWGQ